MTKISIIVPVFNVAVYLKDCLDSILSQSFKDFEVICVNDGSNDNSLDILEDYAQKDSRIVIINQENQGVSAARNNGLSLATGEFILFVDPDDYILDNALDILYNSAKQNNSKILIFDYYELEEQNNNVSYRKFINGVKRKYKNQKKFTISDMKSIGLKKIPRQVWRNFYKRDFLQKNNLRFLNVSIAEDILFSLNAFFIADEFYYLNECLYCYRIRKASAVETVSDINFEIFTVIENIKKILENRLLFKKLNGAYYDYIIDLMAMRFDYVRKEKLIEYQIKCREYLRNWFDYKKLLFQANRICSFSEWLFSVKNRRQNGIKFKQVTILGLSFVF